jgi:hypothetical protein
VFAKNSAATHEEAVMLVLPTLGQEGAAAASTKQKIEVLAQIISDMKLQLQSMKPTCNYNTA